MLTALEILWAVVVKLNVFPGRGPRMLLFALRGGCLKLRWSGPPSNYAWYGGKRSGGIRQSHSEFLALSLNQLRQAKCACHYEDKRHLERCPDPNEQAVPRHISLGDGRRYGLGEPNAHG
jgi:hypothetical protein